MNLSGKVAIVTGSGRGLGLAYAVELARCGAAVVVNDVDDAVADSAVKAITEDGGWALELAKAQITVNAIVPVAATAMTETVPFLKPYVDALRAGEPLPPFARRELGFGSPEDAAGVVAFLASDAAARVTGQAIGIGGDRLALWSHPAEVIVEFAEGTGWSAEAISGIWAEKFAPALQQVGQQFPEPPK